jgi:hypothetical protein
MQDWIVILLKMSDAANISGNNDLRSKLFAGSIEMSQFAIA